MFLDLITFECDVLQDISVQCYFRNRSGDLQTHTKSCQIVSQFKSHVTVVIICLKFYKPPPSVPSSLFHHFIPDTAVV